MSALIVSYLNETRLKFIYFGLDSAPYRMTELEEHLLEGILRAMPMHVRQ